MNKSRLLGAVCSAIVQFIGRMSAAILMMQSGLAIGGMIGDRTELEAILGDSLVLEDFESVELNFPTPPLTPELWTGPVLDSGVGIVDGIVFTREPPGNLTVQDPLLLGGNQVLKTNSGAIAIDFLSPVPAFGFDFVRPTNTQTEVTLNVYAEDDVTILATESITLYFNGFIGFSELGGIGKATVSSFSVSLPYVTETRIDNVTFGLDSNGTIEIDIKPKKKTDENVIYLKRDKRLKVAIVGSTTFDALQVNPATVKFGPSEASPIQFKGQDYNRDGYSDLILIFKLSETGISCGDEDAILVGTTYDGEAIEGSDDFTVQQCP